MDAVLMDAVLVDAVLVDAVLMDAVAMDAVLMDAVLVDAVLVDAVAWTIGSTAPAPVRPRTARPANGQAPPVWTPAQAPPRIHPLVAAPADRVDHPLPVTVAEAAVAVVPVVFRRAVVERGKCAESWVGS